MINVFGASRVWYFHVGLGKSAIQFLAGWQPLFAAVALYPIVPCSISSTHFTSPNFSGCIRRTFNRNLVTLCGKGRLKEPLNNWPKQQLSHADPATLHHLLKECGSKKSLADAKRVDAQITTNGLWQDILLGNRLIWTYDKCSSPKDAWRTFENLHHKNLVSWNMMIGLYAHHGHGAKALQLFKRMQKEGIKPDKVTFLNILDVCGNPLALNEGRLMHAYIVDSQMELDIAVATALVNMYGKCGSVEEACRMFRKMSTRNVVSWTVMIAAFAQQGCLKEALHLFVQMHGAGFQPNKITFVTMLNAFKSPAALTEGKLIHAYIVDRRYESDKFVGTALVSMYGRCGSLEDARHMFDNMLTKQDVVLWTAMITAYTQYGHARWALQLFCEMSQQALKPNQTTFVSVVDACTSLSSLPEGKLLHVHIVIQGFDSNLVVGNALVNMYSKCGSMEDACMAFNKMPEHDVVSWNAIIAAYAQHGDGKEALQLFQQMQHQSIKPDKVTIISILSACSHAGMVDEACHYIDHMSQEHGIKPTVEHYRCVVDLLGRVGRLEEAVDFIGGMPHKPGALAWLSLLGASSVHGNMEQGKHAIDHIVELESHNATAYVTSKWEETAKYEIVNGQERLRKELVAP